MKKLLLFLLLCLGLTVSSFADYLDDWPDDALCGWMENPLPPSYMVEEVKTRGISCSGGIPVPPEIVVPCLLEPCDPIEPIVPPIRPGWKILKGTDMWVIDETDPYWQTPEGLIQKNHLKLILVSNILLKQFQVLILKKFLIYQLTTVPLLQLTTLVLKVLLKHHLCLIQLFL